MNTYSMTQSTSKIVSPHPRRTSTLAALTFAGLALAMAGPAMAVSVCAHPDLVPGKALFLGPNVSSASSESNGGGYAFVCCRYWVVDISVPSNSSGLNNDLKSFTIWANESGPYSYLTEPDCKNFWDRTYVYKKPNGATKFQWIAYWERKGEPNPQSIVPCTLKYQPGAVPLSELTPPATGTDVYRVMSVRKSGANWVTVKVQAEHLKP
ncbi:MAG TPA: hypothetical protein VHC97_06995 [Thermoanaerobaculia bacterium]|jgi:hypothetical protein|nr:hypothetical protein [Thermoanaerobaculia bacterium]